VIVVMEDLPQGLRGRQGPVPLQLSRNRRPVDGCDTILSHSGNGILSDCHLERDGSIDHTVRIVAASTSCMAAKAKHTSIVTPATIRFLRPVFAIAATNAGSFHALMIPGRSITDASGNRLTISGINGLFGLRPRLVITTVGRLKTFPIFASAIT
jgi:hypothetical protein